MLPYKVIAVLITFTLLNTAFAQSDYAVYLQESPAGAGEIKPGMGVQTFPAQQVVSLSTAPNPGYHFVGWLGDVRDPVANRTSLTVDGPKIVIAVFERDRFEALDGAGPQLSVGPAALYPHYATYTNDSGTWDPPYYPPHPPPYPPPPNPPRDDPPPVPQVPEPATILLVGIGIGFLNRRKKIIYER